MKGLGSVSHLCLGEGGLGDDTLLLPINEARIKSHTIRRQYTTTQTEKHSICSCTNQDLHIRGRIFFALRELANAFKG